MLGMHSCFPCRVLNQIILKIKAWCSVVNLAMEGGLQAQSTIVKPLESLAVYTCEISSDQLFFFFSLSFWKGGGSVKSS
jgi:hypothetical protein